MKIVMFYFSGTGNSWWSGKKILEELEKENEVMMFSVENSKLKNRNLIEKLLKDVDHVVIGYPVYASRMPEPMNRFVELLPKSNHVVNLSIYCTQATASGDGAIYNKKLFFNKNFLIKQTLHLKMGNNLYIPHLKISPLKGEEHLNRLNAKALEKIKVFAENIKNNKKRIVGLNPFGIFLGQIQRAFYHVTISSLSKSLSVERDKCIRCNLCVKNCPEGNIKMNAEGIQFNENCVACMRCYNFCPKECILMGEKTIDSKKFYRYKGPAKLKLSDIQV